MKHLTTIENIKSDTRFVSNVLDPKKIDIYIDESEQLNIIPAIGTNLFIDISEFINGVNPVDRTFSKEFGGSYPDYDKLLNGGIYTIYEYGVKRRYIFKGLTETLNYYVWARIVKNNNYTVSRFGLVNKTDQYSQNAELKERLVVEKDALSIADRYLSDVLKYLILNNNIYPLFDRGIKKNRLNISIIGD